MEIGNKLRNLRMRKNLTQEELGQRTDLTKGYISQLENNLSSPSLETFFAILEVLGTTPKDFFDEEDTAQQVVYSKEQVTIFTDQEKGYTLTWLVPESNEKDMEPVMITLDPDGEYRHFPPSLAETFGYVLSGSLELQLGGRRYDVKKGQSFYYEANQHHQIRNASAGSTKVLLVATESYL